MKNEVDSIVVLVEETADALTKEIRVSQFLLILFVLLSLMGFFGMAARQTQLLHRIEELERK